MKNLLNVFLTLFVAALFAGCDRNSTASYQGYIEGEYVYVASPLGGALTNLDVARGDSVKAGQILFELERQSEAAALAQAEKNLAMAQANLKLAESVFQRRSELRSSPSGVVSQEELDTARSQRDADAARLAGEQAALDKARWSYDQKEQFAPTNAMVQDTLYRSGEWVAAGSPVVVLLPPTNLKVRFFVPQGILPRIKVGETVSVHCDGAVHDFKAVVNYISSQAEYTPPVIYSRESRASIVFMIEAKISSGDASDVRPGQPVDVTLD
jgi:HlyD family secretion protein